MDGKHDMLKIFAYLVDAKVPLLFWKRKLEKLNSKLDTQNKIVDTCIEGTRIEDLQEKSFGELWDMLIDYRISQYTKTFEDKDYEKIMINFW